MDLKSSPSSGCAGDFLGFYSGGKVDGDETLIRKSCGSSDAGMIISSRGRVIMRFFTDQSPQDGNGAGWEVEYFIGGCGGDIKNQNGTIDLYSHALEGLDSKQVNCTWILEAEGFWFKLKQGSLVVPACCRPARWISGTLLRLQILEKAPNRLPKCRLCFVHFNISISSTLHPATKTILELVKV